MVLWLELMQFRGAFLRNQRLLQRKGRCSCSRDIWEKVEGFDCLQWGSCASLKPSDFTPNLRAPLQNKKCNLTSSLWYHILLQLESIWKGITKLSLLFPDSARFLPDLIISSLSTFLALSARGNDWLILTVNVSWYWRMTCKTSEFKIIQSNLLN